jgi:hypothetical protein
MMEKLMGSKSVARILLFLLVNERCYGTQIQTLLQVPLTAPKNLIKSIH